MSRLFLAAGAINAFLSVALGALSKHSIHDQLDAHTFEIFQTGTEYHINHALGLILIGLISQQWKRSFVLRWAGWSLLVGMTLFSGSLYLLAITGISSIGMITPIGGTCLLAGWLFLAWAVIIGKGD